MSLGSLCPGSAPMAFVPAGCVSGAGLVVTVRGLPTVWEASGTRCESEDLAGWYPIPEVPVGCCDSVALSGLRHFRKFCDLRFKCCAQSRMSNVVN